MAASRYNFLGGLCGNNWGGTITNCYSTGSVMGGYDSYRLGGLCGFNRGNTIISNCYSTGSVTGDEYVGGLVGYNYGTVLASFWDIETSGQDTSAGGTGLSTAEMQMQVTFMDAGWDFVCERINSSEDIWMMTCEGMSYPKLSWWRPILGDFLCPDGVEFFDFTFFAAHWQKDNCGASNDCNGTDLDLFGTVDTHDLRLFVNNWLKGF